MVGVFGVTRSARPEKFSLGHLAFCLSGDAGGGKMSPSRCMLRCSKGGSLMVVNWRGAVGREQTARGALVMTRPRGCKADGSWRESLLSLARGLVSLVRCSPALPR